jgi:hypothetical protein
LFNNRLTGNLPWSIGSLRSLNVLLLQQNNFTGSLPASINQLVNVTIWDLTGNPFSSDAFLPSPLCPLCDRTSAKSDVRGCSSSVQGYLMACSSPRAFVVSRDPRMFGNGSITALPVMGPILQRIPESCLYRYS